MSLLHLDLERLPKHIAIIMDGNGRWATSRGLDRARGHRAGVLALKETITACVRLGIDVLSAYAFSTENWKRPRREVDLLMRLFAETLLKELPLFFEHQVRLEFLGDLSALPKKTREIFEKGRARTAHHKGMVLALAVNYGARAEILRATQVLASQVQKGELAVSDIDETTFTSQLYTAGLPDPELLIRTSGELRLSNFLLWQLAYAEFYPTRVFWPDFDRYELLRAIRAFQKRDRRFGALSQEVSDAPHSIPQSCS